MTTGWMIPQKKRSEKWLDGSKTAESSSKIKDRSEFFGLTDSLFVKRRQGRDREVHICKIEKENVNEYINNIQDKLIVLYGYNPTNKKLTNERQIEILKEQLKYEKAQFKRLNGIRHGEHNYTGVLDDMHSKSSKILKLKSKLQKCKEKERDEEIGK